MLKIYACDISRKLTEVENDSSHQFISPQRIEKMERMKFSEDRLRSMHAELLLRFALVRDFGYHNDNIRLSTSSSGKPVLADQDMLHFNLSHSGSWVFCAISDQAVGVDIEKISEGDNGFMEMILHPAEILWLQESQEQEKNTNYYKLWCLKEAYGKFLGVGLNYDLQKTRCEVQDGIWSLAPQHEADLGPCHSSVRTFTTGYIIAVCSVRKIPSDIHKIQPEELVNALRKASR